MAVLVLTGPLADYFENRLLFFLALFGQLFVLFDLGLTSLSTFFSHIATVSGCGRELNAHF